MKDALHQINLMLNEVHSEAMMMVNPFDVTLCYAKRDALSELNQRLLGQRGNNMWARQRPEVPLAARGETSI